MHTYREVITFAHAHIHVHMHMHTHRIWIPLARPSLLTRVRERGLAREGLAGYTNPSQHHP